MQAELNVPAASPAPAALPARRRFAFVKIILKTIYIAVATSVSLFVVSFTPEQGGSLANLPVATTSIVVHVPDPRALYNFVERNPALQAALADDDVREIFPLAAKRAELLGRLKQMPRGLQRFIAPTPDAILPWLGSEWLLTLQNECAEVSKPPGLLYVRIAGGRGHVARLALYFASLKRRTAAYDMGDGILALSINNANPHNQSRARVHPQLNAPPAGALLQGWLLPHYMSPRAARRDSRLLPDMLRDAGLPQGVLDALKAPPMAVEIFRLNDLPRTVDFSLNADESGTMTLNAQLGGATIAATDMVAAPADEPAAAAQASGVLPLDVRALFMWYLEKQMRPKKGLEGLSRTQRRWLTRFEHLTALGIDFDRDLWPAFGGSVRFAVRPSPPELTTQYGVLTAQLPFDASHPHARQALGELARERWEHLFDGAPPKAAKPPFVRRIRAENAERYVLATNIAAPAWTVYARHIHFESDAGAFALRQTEIPPDTGVRLQRAERYFLEADGARLAPMAEAYATFHFDELEEELGTGEFLERYPDAAVQIRAVGKLTRAAGRISLSAQPRQPDFLELRLVWTPGQIAAPESTDNSPAPPPAK